MSDLNPSPVVPIDRTRRARRVMAVRRRLREAKKREQRGSRRGRGRVWVNGGELGGARAALSHLSESYD